MDETRLRGELREAAAAHRPDRARILARVERGMAAPPPRRERSRGFGAGRRWTVTAAVAATVVGVVALGGLAVTALQDRPAPPPVAVAPGPPARAAGSVDPGSNRWWAQSDLAVTSDVEVTALTVELRVALTGGVVSTGRWQTRSADDFTVTVAEERGALVYRWTLKEGRAVPAGPHTFAAQYNHAEGTRDASADTYTVVLTAPDGGRTTLRGGFG
ncbi:FimB/Mfa2 family fimbrial subunit [Streptomyces hydrogenans]|uniref:Anti-sigma factor n=2 Tax=Streptomyces hydrogenans TaxID=1873719 RepID=A0ABQ3PN03_9ACTN|nr:MULTISPECIES: FimB/Mfa2 family fimbrial subunit [Streptomyces]MCM1947116.1 FimB/Mfa2 family fimbrial subunit [Streptomyces sp. G2]GHI26397.1 hypothetical protein Shyd_77680 [Streptomyces hydrogenans]